jgi:hypothetical protein
MLSTPEGAASFSNIVMVDDGDLTASAATVKARRIQEPASSAEKEAPWAPCLDSQKMKKGRKGRERVVKIFARSIERVEWKRIQAWMMMMVAMGEVGVCLADHTSPDAQER